MNRPTRLGLMLLAGFAARGCSSSSPASTPSPSSPLQPGEVCDPSLAGPVHLRFDPPVVVVAQGQVRPVRLIVDPDMCVPTAATMTVSDTTIAQAPSSAPLDLRHPTFDFDVRGMATGKASVVVSVQRPPQGQGADAWPGDPTPIAASLPVVVNDGTTPSCHSPASPGAMSGLSASSPTIAGSGDAADASLSVPPGAFMRTDELALPAFSAAIGCASDLSGGAPAKPLKLGPAVTFTPQDPTWSTHSLRREIDFAIPVNPAAMPTGARMRHVQVLYQGPRAKTPRAIPVANPRFEQLANGRWVLRFSSPWFGTYQAAVVTDAGTRHFKRHLTHRAVVGFSMGAGGAASFGLRHHDQFDAIAPMGGPSDWTWLLWFVENYALGGFCPASQASCPTTPPNLYPLQETYAHTEDFDHWWYQDGGGNGGHFARGDYIQIFEDLALMQGNPNGQNGDPTLSFFPAGLSASDAFVKGTAKDVADCRLFIDPISPSSDDTSAQQAQEQQAQMQQQQAWNECVQSRCDLAHTWTSPKPYYDATYNPDGSHPVISFCDGAPQNTMDSPYDDTWADPYEGTTMPTSAMPVDMALAVDLNGNGKRDADEPVIRQGHEPWQDTGSDGVPDAQEPGYDPVVNPDPNQDDYDFQVNPGGTEGNHRYEAGEPYRDVGLDGVPNTPQQSAGGYDVGEGDGQFTMASGLQSFYANDSHSMIAGWSTPPAGPLDDDALARIDVWSDGGVRDLFNFGAVANHLEGAIAARHRPDGTPVKTTAFYDNFEHLPGEDPKNPDQFQAADILWSDVADAPSLRYGTVDATTRQIMQGDGQHVGTGSQILDRLVTSFYFAASKWPDADRTVNDELVPAPDDPDFNGETTTVNQLGTGCELKGHCETYFTGPKTGRTGPIAVTLPPGYALEANRVRDVRYPVLYVLHGYGQDPRDLEATAAITNNYMNDQTRSSADRLAKMIVVYVDGRCRMQTLPDPAHTQVPECIRGTFYLNGNRVVRGSDGKLYPIARIDDWFDEVIDYIDQNYRTLPPTDIDVVE